MSERKHEDFFHFAIIPRLVKQFARIKKKPIKDFTKEDFQFEEDVFTTHIQNQGSEINASL